MTPQKPPYWVVVRNPKHQTFPVGQVVKTKDGGCAFLCSTPPRNLDSRFSAPKVLDTVLIDHLLDLENFKAVVVHFRGAGVVYRLDADFVRQLRTTEDSPFRRMTTGNGVTRDYYVVPVTEWEQVTVKEPFKKPDVKWGREIVLSDVPRAKKVVSKGRRYNLG